MSHGCPARILKFGGLAGRTIRHMLVGMPIRVSMALDSVHRLQAPDTGRKD